MCASLVHVSLPWSHLLFNVLPGNITQIELRVWKKSHSFAIVHWSKFEMNDPRELLNWVLNYREA